MDWCIDSKKVGLALENSKESYRIRVNDIVYEITSKQKYSNEKLALIEQNMKTFYQKYWKWDPVKKRKELKLKEMRFINVLKENQLIGFASYTFIHEHDEDKTLNVLYLFEIQIKDKGNGIGTLLLKKIIKIAKDFEMEQIRLTCFKNNAALEWYIKYGFIVTRDYGEYVDLSKEVEN